MGYRINHMPDTHFGYPRPTDEERAVKLTEFLLARIDEDEAVARAATAGPWHWEGDYPEGHCPHGTEWTDHGPDLVSAEKEVLGRGLPYPQEVNRVVLHANGYDASGLDVTDADAAHIARHDPARVLAECEAKRRIVEALARAGEGEYGGYGAAIEYAQEIVLGSLVLPYADHEDFREEWKP